MSTWPRGEAPEGDGSKISPIPASSWTGENPTTTLGGHPTISSQGWWGESSNAFKPLNFLTSASSRASKDYFKQILSSNKPECICQASSGQHYTVSRNASHLDVQFELLIGLQLITRVQVLGHMQICCQRCKYLAVC